MIRSLLSRPSFRAPGVTQDIGVGNRMSLAGAQDEWDTVPVQQLVDQNAHTLITTDPTPHGTQDGNAHAGPLRAPISVSLAFVRRAPPFGRRLHGEQHGRGLVAAARHAALLVAERSASAALRDRLQ